MAEDSDEGTSKSRPFTAYDVQKVRLEKLFSNIEKPVEIPSRKTDKKFANAPEFVRNVMGSSAGAGSGEFHVYRHLRRKEFARLNFIETQALNDQLDNNFQKKIEDNRRRAEEITNKKRAKRQKKKEKLKSRKSAKKELNEDGKSGDEDKEKEDKDSSKDDSNDSADKRTD